MINAILSIKSFIFECDMVEMCLYRVSQINL